MNKELYQKLRDKIIEANPSILEREILYRCNRVWDAWNINTMTREDFEEVDLSEDINLSDCLIALRSEGISIRVNTMGEFFEHQPKTGKWEVNNSTVFWIFNKPLQDQSDEVLGFLADLILNK